MLQRLRPSGQTGRPLVGIGLYTPSEASRLTGIGAIRISRWLRGHSAAGHIYEPLWQPQVDLGDGRIYLGFRDLVEVHIASAFIRVGLSAQQVRLAIRLAADIVGEHPLSTEWLRTDGRSVFLKVLAESGDEPKLLNLFSRQFAFNAIVERSFKDVVFKDHSAVAWWPLGQRAGVLIDPARAFGQPIERDTSIPTEVLAHAAIAEGSAEAAARAWEVPVPAVQRAIRFQQRMASMQTA